MNSHLKDLMLFGTLTALLMTLGSLVSSRHPATRQPHRRIGRGLGILASPAPSAAAVERSTRERAIERRITAEYREMPGLRLTTAQAARLFGLDDGTARRVLSNLRDSGVLRELHDGRFLKRG